MMEEEQGWRLGYAQIFELGWDSLTQLSRLLIIIG